MCDHVHEWKYTRDRTHPFICHKCFPTGALSIAEAEAMLNEHAQLEAENAAAFELLDVYEKENQRLREVAQGPSFGEMLEMGRWLKGSMKIWDDYGHFKTGLEAQINAWIVRGVCDALKEGE